MMNAKRRGQRRGPVIVGVDLSDCCLLVVSEAISVAEHMGATAVELVYACAPPDGVTETAAMLPDPDAPPLSVRTFMETHARLRLPLYAELVREAGLEVTCRVVTGSVESVLASIAESVSSPAVVLGGKPRNGSGPGLGARLATRTEAEVRVLRFIHGVDCVAPNCCECRSGVTEVHDIVQGSVDPSGHVH